MILNKLSKTSNLYELLEGEIRSLRTFEDFSFINSMYIGQVNFVCHS